MILATATAGGQRPGVDFLPLTIDVQERRGDGPSRIGQSRAREDIRECAVTVVLQQRIGAQAGEIDVGPAVIVDVAGRHTHSVRTRDQSCAFGDVGESDRPRPIRTQLKIVSVQPILGVLALVALAEHLTLNRVDIQVTIVIEVEQSDTWSHDLREVVLTGHSIHVHEIEPHRLRLLRKPADR